MAAVEDITNSVDVWTFDTRSPGFFLSGASQAAAPAAAALTPASNVVLGTLVDTTAATTVNGKRQSPGT